MTGTQTGELLNKGKGGGGYGLGFTTTRKPKGDGPTVAGPCGHGGAYSTNLSIDPDRKLVTVFMVQHAGFADNQGGAIRGAFGELAAAKLPSRSDEVVTVGARAPPTSPQGIHQVVQITRSAPPCVKRGRGSTNCLVHPDSRR